MPRRASVSSWSGRRKRRNSICDHFCRAEALRDILSHRSPPCRAEALPHILHSHGAGDSYPAPLAPPPAAPPPPPPPPTLAPAPADDVLACVPRNATKDALRSSSTRAAA